MRQSCFSFVILGGILAFLAEPAWLHAQGFGTIKKKITLHRTLPATAHLTSTSIAVQVIARDAKYKDLSQKFADMVETELLKNDQHLTVEPAHPGTLVACAIESISIGRQVVTNPNINIPVKKNQQLVGVQEIVINGAQMPDEVRFPCQLNSSSGPPRG